MRQNIILNLEPLQKRFLFFITSTNTPLIYTILHLFILLSSASNLQAQFSNQSEISILTCAPGEELYSIFGHTAIRVQDSISNSDYVFNYGTFDFNTSNFYLKFMKGELNYILSVTTFDRFIREYEYQRRSVIEQHLNLTTDEKERIIDALIKNSLPENREYHYHFFYDNCATRVRDIIDVNISDDIEFKALSADRKGMTYRDAIGVYLIHSQWTKFGMDLILGEPTDEILNRSTIQFLPDFLYDQFKTAKKHDNVQLVEYEESVISFPKQTKPSVFIPSFVLWIVFAIIASISWFEISRRKLLKVVNISIFLPVSLLSLLIIFLWFFTFHSVTAYNWNLVWANPLNFMMIVPVLKNTKRFIWIPWIIIISNLIMFVLYFIIPQEIPKALFPIWLALTLRSALYIRILN